MAAVLINSSKTVMLVLFTRPGVHFLNLYISHTQSSDTGSIHECVAAATGKKIEDHKK